MKRYLHAFLMFISGMMLVFMYFELVFRIDFIDIPMRLFVYGALAEESMKIAVALIAIRLGVKPLTVAFIGIGYGFGEQLVHLLYTIATLITPWMHLLAGVSMAVMLDRAIKTKLRKYYVLAFILPLLIHGLYNQFWATLLWYYSLPF